MRSVLASGKALSSSGVLLSRSIHRVPKTVLSVGRSESASSRLRNSYGINYFLSNQALPTDGRAVSPLTHVNGLGRPQSFHGCLFLVRQAVGMCAECDAGVAM